MPQLATLVCPICGRALKETRFIADRSNQETGRAQMCVDCMCTGVDNRDPKTFLHILQHFDKPFLEQNWAKATNKAYQKDPREFGPTSVIGGYLRTMAMAQYSHLKFEHSDKSIALLDISRPPQIEEYWGKVRPIELSDEIPDPPKRERKERPPKEKDDSPKDAPDDDKSFEERIKKSKRAMESNSRTAALMANDGGEPAKVDTSGAGASIIANEIRKVAKELVDAAEAQQVENMRIQRDMRVEGTIAGIDPSLQADNDAMIMNSLTQEDQMYLIGKWGAYYTPSQWVKMERMYREYANEYDLNIDRAETLKKICSTSVKMDEALEMGDVNAYKNLSAVYGQLRKDGKFTEAQNKTEVVRPFDTIGEIVRLCEDEGGPIPAFGDPDMYPQDQLDVILNDYKEYVFHLVKNEMGLGQIIEKYVEKLEKAERDKEDAMLKSLRSDLSAEDLDANVARMNLAEAIKREAEQLDYNDSSTYRTKMQNERRKALDEVVDNVT